MEEKTSVPSQYHPDDWISDYEWFASLTKQLDCGLEGMETQLFHDHFRSTRPDASTATYCEKRFVAAMTYLEQHVEAINFGTAGVVGERELMVSRAVVIALYRFFAARPDHAIGLDIPVEIFQAVIKEGLKS